MTTPSFALPRRPYGPRQVPLSIIGFGGILVTGAEQEHANRLVERAVEHGVNYFDVAPQYGDAEIKLGPALLVISVESGFFRTLDDSRPCQNRSVRFGELRAAAEYPDSQQVQLGAAVHFPLDQLQSIHVAFGPAVAPRQLHRGPHLRPVPDQPLGKPVHLPG